MDTITLTIPDDTREAWLNRFIDASRPVFAAAGYPLPERVRVSIGFTSTGYKSSRIGECWSDTASNDQHHEIFLNPTIDEPSRLCDILTHELCHAQLGTEAGHGKAFKTLATAMGLTGKMRSTIAGELWYKLFAGIIADLGPMPYASIKSGMTPPRKKKKTYLLKVECADCGWLARVTATHCHPDMTCPLPGCGGTLTVDGDTSETDSED